MNIKRVIYCIVYMFALGIGMDNMSIIRNKIRDCNSSNLISEIYINYIIILCSLMVVNLLYPRVFKGDVKLNKWLYYSIPFIMIIIIIFLDIILALIIQRK